MTPISRGDFRLTLPHAASEPPRPVVLVNPDMPADLRELFARGTIIAPTLGYSLLRSAYHLAEDSRQFADGYREGKSISYRCTALATGAIAVACAGVEAVMNEVLLFLREVSLEPAKKVLLERATSYIPRDRLTAIAAAADHSADWGLEPFQSYDLLLTVRRVVVHHEPEWVSIAQGYWPAKKLKDAIYRIDSPYATIEALDWSHHLLTPHGASWAVDTAFSIANLVEGFYDKLYPEGPGIL